MRNLSATRWCVRADSIRAVWSSFDEITRGLEELEDSDDNKTKAKAENLLARVRSFQFIVMIMFMKSVMIKTKILTKQVQSVNINIVDTLQSAKVTAFGTQMERERSVRLITLFWKFKCEVSKDFFSKNSAFFSKFRSQNFNKKCAQNAGNRISEALDFKIFRGRVPPDPPILMRVFGGMHQSAHTLDPLLVSCNNNSIYNNCSNGTLLFPFGTT